MTDPDRAGRVVVRADAGPNVGTGHVIRCLTLADELRSGGARVTFVGRGMPSALVGRLERQGHTFIALADPESHESPAGWSASRQRADARATREVVQHVAASTVVVDHYGLGEAWEREVRDGAVQVLAIDDLADRVHDCDLLLDQNWSGPETNTRYDGLVPDRCLQLLGPRYALLQPRYRQLRADLGREDRTRILVSFGGADPTRENEKFLRALAEVERVAPKVDLVLGALARSERTSEAAADGVRFHSDLPSLADLLATSMVGIGAGGSTTWERWCLEVPSVVTTTAPNQVPVARALHEAGLIRWLGDAAEVSSEVYVRTLRAISEHADVPETPPPIIDAWGASRVAARLLPAEDEPLTIRRATSSDAPAFVSDEPLGVSSLSYLRGPHEWRHRLSSFERRRRDGRGALVIESRGTPIGTIEVEHQDRRVHASCRWDVSMHADARTAELEANVRTGIWDPMNDTLQINQHAEDRSSLTLPTPPTQHPTTRHP